MRDTLPTALFTVVVVREGVGRRLSVLTGEETVNCEGGIPRVLRATMRSCRLSVSRLAWVDPKICAEQEKNEHNHGYVNHQIRMWGAWVAQSVNRLTVPLLVSSQVLISGS